MLGSRRSKSAASQDRRQLILDAALAILREQGLAGLTQPRVAQRTGMRQSHLTYYYPTRLDLLAAAADAAADALLAEMDRSLSGSTRQAAAASIARLVIRAENTRMMMALAEAADTEPPVRAAFGRLADGIVERVAAVFGDGARAPDVDRLQILHALSVGLAVVQLATADRDEQRTERLLELALKQLFPGAV